MVGARCGSWLGGEIAAMTETTALIKTCTRGAANSAQKDHGPEYDFLVPVWEAR
jgi:hypothetical protein